LQVLGQLASKPSGQILTESLHFTSAHRSGGASSVVWWAEQSGAQTEQEPSIQVLGQVALKPSGQILKELGQLTLRQGSVCGGWVLLSVRFCWGRFIVWFIQPDAKITSVRMIIREGVIFINSF
jgi:hypothetical protein